jgi:hypothetical protein
MRWKRESKNLNPETFAYYAEKNLFKAKRLPAAAARYLVVQLGHNPAWVKRLKCAVRLKEGENNIYELRVFDGLLATKTGVRVENYHSLDSYPELIIYEGWIDKNADIAFLK